MLDHDFDRVWNDFVFCSDQKKKEDILRQLVELATTINTWLRILAIPNLESDIKKRGEEQLRKLFSQRKISPAILAQFAE